jgi:hypothetical protein
VYFMKRHYYPGLIAALAVGVAIIGNSLSLI